VVTDIFKAGGGEKMAKDMDVPVLGRIPIDPAIGEGCDSGNPFVRYRDSSVTAECFNQMVLSILAFLERGEGEKDNGKQTEEVSRK